MKIDIYNYIIKELKNVLLLIGVVDIYNMDIILQNPQHPYTHIKMRAI